MGLDFCCLESVGSLVISESCEHFFCWFRAVGDVVDVNGDVDHVRSDIKVPLHLAKGLLKALSRKERFYTNIVPLLPAVC